MVLCLALFKTVKLHTCPVVKDSEAKDMVGQSLPSGNKFRAILFLNVIIRKLNT
jgi:hypothetical protein